MSDELLEAAAAFQRCIEQRDHEAAERILHEDYALVLVHPQPALMPRARWVEVLGDYVVHDYRVEHSHVDVDGDTATILTRAVQHATVLGEDRSGTIVISDVWRRSPTGWRVWKRHSTPLAAGRMPGA